jgi:hypothetical protein
MISIQMDPNMLLFDKECVYVYVTYVTISQQFDTTNSTNATNERTLGVYHRAGLRHDITTTRLFKTSSV